MAVPVVANLPGNGNADGDTNEYFDVNAEPDGDKYSDRYAGSAHADSYPDGHSFSFPDRYADRDLAGHIDSDFYSDANYHTDSQPNPDFHSHADAGNPRDNPGRPRQSSDPGL